MISSLVLLLFLLHLFYVGSSSSKPQQPQQATHSSNSKKAAPQLLGHRVVLTFVAGVSQPPRKPNFKPLREMGRGFFALNTTGVFSCLFVYCCAVRKSRTRELFFVTYERVLVFLYSKMAGLVFLFSAFGNYFILSWGTIVQSTKQRKLAKKIKCSFATFVIKIMVEGVPLFPMLRSPSHAFAMCFHGYIISRNKSWLSIVMYFSHNWIPVEEYKNKLVF